MFPRQSIRVWVQSGGFGCYARVEIQTLDERSIQQGQQRWPLRENDKKHLQSHYLQRLLSQGMYPQPQPIQLHLIPHQDNPIFHPLNQLEYSRQTTSNTSSLTSM